MPLEFTDVEVLAQLRGSIAGAGSAAQWARQHGTSPQHVSDVVNGTRGISPVILAALGLERITRYRPKEKDPNG